MSNMRICFVATTVHVSKDLREGVGASTHTMSFAKELAKKNKVFLVSERFEGDSFKEKIEGVEVFRLARGIVASSKKIKKKKLFPLLRRFKGVSNFLLGLKVAEIVKENKCHIIIERGHSLGVGAIASVLTGKPLVLHMVDFIASKSSVNMAKKIIAHSNVFFDDKTKKKVFLSPAGFDPNIFKPIKNKKEFDLCYCGSFKEWDGLKELIEAVKLLKKENKELKTVLVGAGPEFEKTKNLIKKNGLEKNFILKEKVPIKQVPKIISKSLVCVAPFNIKNYHRARFEEFGYYFSPLKVVEYMACGKPVVATNYKMVREIVKDEQQLFEEGNVKDFSEKIINLLNSKKLEKIGEMNTKKVQGMRWSKLIPKIEKELEHVL